jgi:glutaredoxin 3
MLVRLQSGWGRPATALLFPLILVAASVACRKSVPDAPPPAAATLPRLEVNREGKWLYTYTDDAGRFVTGDDVTKIPPASRRLVRVINPNQSANEKVDPSKVYVVDLDELDKKGKVEARVLSREAFETGALSQLPPGESSAFPATTAQAPLAEPGTAAAVPPGGAPVVTLYGASWCGACKAAREYLRSRRIPFADRDIERDQAAARELREKAQRLGVGADRIPVLDVRGRLLIGFDKARLEALLGEAT